MKVELCSITNPKTKVTMDVNAVSGKNYYATLGWTIASVIIIGIIAGRKIYKMGAVDANAAAFNALRKLDSIVMD